MTSIMLSLEDCDIYIAALEAYCKSIPFADPLHERVRLRLYLMKRKRKQFGGI